MRRSTTTDRPSLPPGGLGVEPPLAINPNEGEHDAPHHEDTPSRQPAARAWRDTRSLLRGHSRDGNAPPSRFGIVIHRSTQQEPIEIASPPSFSPQTNAQRGNLGAVITIFEWLELSQAQGHEVAIYTAEQYILDLEASSCNKDSKVKDLYAIIVPKLGDWPLVRSCPSRVSTIWCGGTEPRSSPARR
jgi:hypothetical protein